MAIGFAGQEKTSLSSGGTRDSKTVSISSCIGLNVALLLLASLFLSPLRADMILTAAGVADGFTLSTFASGIPNNGGVGPVGITFEPGGQVMVSSYAAGKIAVFATDTDGQSYAAAALSSTSYSGPAGLTTSSGNYYVALQGSGLVDQVDVSGNFVQTIVTGTPLATGIATNPDTGNLFVSTLGQ